MSIFKISTNKVKGIIQIESCETKKLKALKLR